MLLGLGNIGSLGWAGTMVVALAVRPRPDDAARAARRAGAARQRPPRAVPRPRAGSAGPRGLALARDHGHGVSLAVLRAGRGRPAPALGLPLAHLRVGAGDETALPRDAESRRAAELLRREFPGQDVNRILVVLDARDGVCRSRPSASRRPMRSAAGWRRGPTSRGSTASSISIRRSTWRRTSRSPRCRADMRPPELAAALEQLVGDHVALLVVSTPSAPSSDEARALVREIRAAHPPFDGEVLVAGADRVRPRLHRPDRAPRPARGRPHRGRDLSRAVRAARLRAPARSRRWR